MVTKSGGEFDDIIIVSGGAAGADTLAEKFADEYGYKKHIMLANWEEEGKNAGFNRNIRMHEYIAEEAKDGYRVCLCFWDGKSAGTLHNFGLCRKYGTRLVVYNFKDNYLRVDDKAPHYGVKI